MFSKRIFTGKRLIPSEFPVDTLLWEFQSLPRAPSRRNLNVRLKDLFRSSAEFVGFERLHYRPASYQSSLP